MIIFIDGPCGVGKTTVMKRVERILGNDDYEYIDYDILYQDIIRHDYKIALGTGTKPNNNEKTLKVLIDKINEIITIKNAVVCLSITEQIAKQLLLDYYNQKSVKIVHFILEAKESTIIQRIEKRNTDNKDQQFDFYKNDIAFLKEQYLDAIRIDTTNCDEDEVAKIIIKYIKNES